ncbi:MAG: hypothetical protein LRY73_05195 [Bacillus sp. (in: Bacteria)]|nr:hypothetical protein [Bacillus sp. (in: firmicutes)]
MVELIWPIIFGLMICIAWATKGSKSHGCAAVGLIVLLIAVLLVTSLISLF